MPPSLHAVLLPQYVVQQRSHVKGSCVYRHSLHCDVGVHRGAGGRRDADALCDSKGVCSLQSFSPAPRAMQASLPVLLQACGESLTRELRRAEPEEHFRAAGAEEVQQVLEAAYGAPRNKVSKAPAECCIRERGPWKRMVVGWLAGCPWGGLLDTGHNSLFTLLCGAQSRCKDRGCCWPTCSPELGLPV